VQLVAVPLLALALAQRVLVPPVRPLLPPVPLPLASPWVLLPLWLLLLPW
jgi:hypothetical protein